MLATRVVFFKYVFRLMLIILKFDESGCVSFYCLYTLSQYSINSFCNTH